MGRCHSTSITLCSLLLFLNLCVPATTFSSRYVHKVKVGYIPIQLADSGSSYKYTSKINKCKINNNPELTAFSIGFHTLQVFIAQLLQSKSDIVSLNMIHKESTKHTTVVESMKNQKWQSLFSFRLKHEGTSSGAAAVLPAPGLVMGELNTDMPSPK